MFEDERNSIDTNKHNRRANCSQTTGERLAWSVASHGGGGVHRGLMGAALGGGRVEPWGWGVNKGGGVNL